MPAVYSIESDGQMYKETISVEYKENEDGEIKVEEKREGIERVDYTGEVLFSHLLMKEKEDHLLDFNALFWKGELKEILLKDHQKLDNADRKEVQDKIKKIFDDSVKKEKSSLSTVKNFYKKCVRFFCSCFRVFFMSFVKLFMKIERWLT